MPPSLPVIGRYHVVERLAEGGMGTVYLARDPALDRLVVIKVLRGGMDDDELRERFSREARSISRLRHPNIVTIFEYGDFQGQPFIAMEYIAGETLAELIKRRAPIALGRKLQMMEELCAGMAYAHRSKIVHRDLKPLNIMVDAEGGLMKILDFGIARSLETSLTGLTSVIGTPSYMSPEQAQGSRVDHRSDIFSIGVVFFEFMAYRRPFSGDSYIAIIQKVLNEPPPALEPLVPGLPPGLVRIIEKSLEKDRESRYQDLEAMRADIAAVRERLAQGASDALGTVPSPDREAPSTPVSSLEKRRALQIAQALDAAAAAMASQNYEAAIESCEQVLLLHSDNTQAIRLHESARAALDRATIAEHLHQARLHLDSREFTKAEQAVIQALSVRSDDQSAIALQKEIAQHRRARDLAAERAAAAEISLSRARLALANGAFDAAVRAAGEALAHTPDSDEARHLRERALAEIEKQRAQHELDVRVGEAIRAAEERFAAGEHSQALRELGQFVPRVPDVATALARLSQRREVLLRQKQQEEERQQQLAAERRAAEERQRRVQIDELTSRVHAAAAEADFTAAQQAMFTLESLRASSDLMDELWRVVDARRAEFEAEEARRATIDERLALAVRRLADRQWEQAALDFDAVLTLDPGHEEAQRGREQVRQAIAERARNEERERQARDIERRLKWSRELIARRLWNDALAEIDAVTALDPHNQEARALRRTAADALAEERQRHHEATVTVIRPVAPTPPSVDPGPAHPPGMVDVPRTRPQQSPLRWAGLAAGAIAIAGLAAWGLSRPATPDAEPSAASVGGPVVSTPAAQPQAPSQPQAQPPSQPAAVAPPPAGPAAPGQTTAEPPTPRSDAPPRAVSDPLASLRPRLVNLLNRGDQRAALDVLARGLAIAGDDPDFTARLNAMARTAESGARTVLESATRADAARVGQPEFGEGQRKLDEASRGALAGDKIAATRAYWAAAELLEASRMRAALEGGRRTQAPATLSTVTSPPPPREVVPEAQPVARAAEPPAAPPVPQQPAATDPHRADQQAIDLLITQLEAAWSSLDAAAVRRLDPRSPRSLDNTFNTYSSLKATFANRQFTFQGDTAIVTCVRVLDGVSKRGNTRQPVLSTPLTFRFQRFGGSWALVETK